MLSTPGENRLSAQLVSLAKSVALITVALFSLQSNPKAQAVGGGIELTAEQLAEAPEFSVPVDCDFDTTCFVQHYFDHGPGSRTQDHFCSGLTYNNHRGIDIRTTTLEQMEQGVNVIAAAEGEVIIVRDGVTDRALNQREVNEFLTNSGLVLKSNQVVIRHSRNWYSLYGHLKKGTVAVKKGQRVRRGQPLGEIGLSGSTSFPHLHFGVMFNNRVIDPFTAREDDAGCQQPARQSLWTEAAEAILTKRKVGILNAGFSDRVEGIDDLKTKPLLSRSQTLTSTQQITFWSGHWGTQKGDHITLEIHQPDGQIARVSSVAEESRVNGYHFLTLPLPPSGQQASGRYVGVFSILRGKKVVASITRGAVVP
ncbi:M23 family metallopeptidase [Kiloniella sp. b19]|uniref:M23 family metallopeptidase n=1 Tax=Kiloniella sp. GXU_MW_B19 TaxID=3141326 RepID=UPI0031DFA65F